MNSSIDKYTQLDLLFSARSRTINLASPTSSSSLGKTPRTSPLQANRTPLVPSSFAPSPSIPSISKNKARYCSLQCGRTKSEQFDRRVHLQRNTKALAKSEPEDPVLYQALTSLMPATFLCTALVRERTSTSFPESVVVARQKSTNEPAPSQPNAPRA